MQTYFTHRKSNWKGAARPVIMAVIFAIGYVLSSGTAYSAGNQSLRDLKTVRAVIDFRTGNPKKALLYLTLIGDTYQERDLRTVTTHPEFLVNFGGESVKLLAKDTKEYSPEEQTTIDEIKEKISTLANEGIKFEYCIYGAKLFGVEPANVPGMSVVDNGWVSLIGYQSSGYSLVPAY